MLVRNKILFFYKEFKSIASDGRNRKKAIAFFMIFLFLAGFFSISAQDQEVSMFVKTVPIVKIYSHPEGFKVIYLKTTMNLVEIYIPGSWFVAGGKGEIIYGRDPSYPYFSVFWKDGKFDFIRLYVQEDLSSLSWGVLKWSENIEENFNIDELELEF